MDDWLAGCLDGDQDAWRAFVDRYAPVIFAAVRRAAHARDDRAQLAQDITQDVFVRLVRDNFRLLRSYDAGRASLATYLTVIAHSTARDALRRRSVGTVPLQEQHQVIEEGVVPTEPVEIPTDLLSDRQRLVLKMLFDKDMSVADTAGVLGITAQSVRSLKHKAISKLRDYFQGEQAGG